MRSLIFFLLALWSVDIYADAIITLKTRGDIAQNIMVLTPKTTPKAVLILFSGGAGTLRLHEETPALGNFLIRSRELFVRHGFALICVDAPMDKQDKDGMYYGFRTSKEHQVDIEGILHYARRTFNKPLWLVGTSRGSESVASLASSASLDIQGIVLSSSITKETKKGRSLLTMNLENITVPALVIAHEKDTCSVTPPHHATALFKRLTHSTVKEIHYFSGGYVEGLNPCKARTYHGYLGIEEKVVKTIVTFIEKAILES